MEVADTFILYLLSLQVATDIKPTLVIIYNNAIVEPLGFLDCGKRGRNSRNWYSETKLVVAGLRKKGVGHAIIWLTCAHVLCVCVNSIQIIPHFVTRALNNG